MRRLPYDGPDPRPARKRGPRDFLPARRRNSGLPDSAFGDPWFIPEDDPGMGTVLGEDIAEDDLYMRMNGRPRRSAGDELDRLERRALAGDPTAVKRLAALARGRALDVDEDAVHARCVRMRPKTGQDWHTDRPFHLAVELQDRSGRRWETYSGAAFSVGICFEEVDPETGEPTISKTTIDGFASSDMHEIRIDGKVAYRSRRPR